MKHLKELIGQKIKCIRPMTKAERVTEGWDDDDMHSATSVIELESGFLLYPSKDDEGNGAGTMFGKDKEGTYYVYDKQTIQ